MEIHRLRAIGDAIELEALQTHEPDWFPYFAIANLHACVIDPGKTVIQAHVRWSRVVDARLHDKKVVLALGAQVRHEQAIECAAHNQFGGDPHRDGGHGHRFLREGWAAGDKQGAGEDEREERFQDAFL